MLSMSVRSERHVMAWQNARMHAHECYVQIYMFVNLGIPNKFVMQWSESYKCTLQGLHVPVCIFPLSKYLHNVFADRNIFHAGSKTSQSVRCTAHSSMQQHGCTPLSTMQQHWEHYEHVESRQVQALKHRMAPNFACTI